MQLLVTSLLAILTAGVLADHAPESNAARLARNLSPLRPRKLYEAPTPVEMAKRGSPSSTLICPSPY